MTKHAGFDWNDLSLGELEDLETATGMSAAEMAENASRPKVLTAVLWVIRRRTDPTFTLEDARQVKLSALASMMPAPAEQPSNGKGDHTASLKALKEGK